MRLWLTRPEPDASHMAGSLRAHGHDVLVAPLLAIEPVADADLPIADLAALIATSKNGLRALAGRDALGLLKGLPLYAVGRATAAEARTIGFSDIIEGEGHAASLLRKITATRSPRDGALLHLAGEMLACDLKGALEALGFRVEQPVLYRSVAADRLPGIAATAIETAALDGVILMSPRTATVYARLIGDAGLGLRIRPLRHFCLSRAIADRLAALAPVVILLPRKPTSEELLVLVEEAAAKFTASCRPGRE
jgi:uroporphyrinogen-III synthase